MALSLDIRTFALLLCSLMIVSSTLDLVDLMVHTTAYGPAFLRRTFWATPVRWFFLAALLFFGSIIPIWLMLLKFGPIDRQGVSCLIVVLAGIAWFCNRLNNKPALEQKGLKEAENKLKTFLAFTKNPSAVPDKKSEQLLLEARMASLHIDDLMGKKPSNATWADEKVSDE